MARRRSSFSRSSAGPSRSSAPATAPRPATNNSPASSQSSPGFFSSMMGTMAQGLAFGAGSEVAHQAIRGVMGGSSHQAHAVDNSQAAPAQANSQTQIGNCQMQNSNFVECLKFNSNNIQSCQEYLNELKKCESGLN